MSAIPSFLIFRANTERETLFKGIFKLEPGNFLIYNLKEKQATIKKYWDLNLNIEEKPEKYFIKKIKNILNDSVRSRLVSDVPYGAYLSGGLDSGTIVSLMNKYSKKPVQTFSVGFEDEEHTETNEARFLAEKLQTNHHELLIKEDSVKKLPEIIYNTDEPMADPTSIPIYFLSEYAKKYCTVILTGEGADEIFAGYPQYKFMKLHQTFIRNRPIYLRNKLPLIMKNLPQPIIDKAFKFASALGEKGIDRFSNFVNTDNYSEQYLNQISIFNKKEQTELLNKKIEIYKKYSPYFKNSTKENIITNCQKLDFKNPMVEDLLMKVDKNTMAHSIEGRVPFLDHRLVELGFKIPPNLRLKGFTNDKYILRKSFKNLLPRQTATRKKKHFFVPINNWFKNELSSLKKELLSKA